MEALSNLGNTLMQRGELEQAEALQRQALQLRPNYTLALCNATGAHARDTPGRSLAKPAAGPVAATRQL
ncbi:MAG: tetratricopeptide repeat protein [Rhodoferax sp.]|nr:tetratricopeptide repeat protein [Rhodoferax sp.]